MGALAQAAHRRFTIRLQEDVGAARRTIARMAAGLPGTPVGDAELATTELGVNIIRHAASGGYLLCRPAGDGIELLAVDHGPGVPAGIIPSAAGGPPPVRPGGLGVGLAAVQRLSSAFDCYSSRRGTVVLARLRGSRRCANGRFSWGGVNVPLGGTGESGDEWIVAADGCLAALVVDGLGHGAAAAAASAAAISVFSEQPESDLEALVRRVHEAMRGTRGGVLAACSIDPARGELNFAGVGNITGRLLLGAQSQTMLSHDGTVGTQLALPRARISAYRWGPGAAVILASDGIASHWDLSAYPGLLRRDPAVIAATLHRDHGRGTDDATMFVVRDARGDAR